MLKKSLLVKCKILALFLNPLTPDDKYSLLNRGDVLQHFQMHLSQKQKIFCPFFFFACSKFRFHFANFLKKMTFIADVF